ncbi:hypothetical protein GQ457_01G017800 [Hibiscus cannabinus]
MTSFALHITSDDLVTFQGAITSLEKGKWLAAMVEEMESLRKNQTWELVRLPEAKGFSQQKGVDYDEIFSPVVRHTSIREILALVASSDFHVEQMDVKIAFVHGDLEDRFIYNNQKASLSLEMNICLDDGSFIFLLLYVDDMLITAKNMHDVVGLKALLSQEFDMKYLGAAKKILGMEIHRDRSSRKLLLS